MRFRRQVLALALWATVGVLVTTTPAYAQTRHVVDQQALQTAINGKTAAETADREAVLTAVHQPEAQAMATKLGLTPTQVDDAVQTMRPADVATLAGPARIANSAQAGGDVIEISLTTLLLFLILIVLIVR